MPSIYVTAGVVERFESLMSTVFRGLVTIRCCWMTARSGQPGNSGAKRQATIQGPRPTNQCANPTWRRVTALTKHRLETRYQPYEVTRKAKPTTLKKSIACTTIPQGTCDP
jgi:hypothetical protein